MERTNSARDEFFIFCSINIGILGLIMGAIIALYDLSFVQCLLVAVFGAASYFMVGFVSISGKLQGRTTLELSKQTFGTSGNLIPNVIAWINFVGWLIVNVVTSALILMAIFSLIGLASSTFTTVVSVLIIVGIAAVCCTVSDQALAAIEKYLTIVFGGLTLLILAYLLLNMNFTPLWQRSSGGFFSDFLPALSIIIAGTGMGWVMAGADYSPAVKAEESNAKLCFATSLGGMIPLIIMFTAGILMSANLSDLASHPNPLELIASSLPSWVALPYYVISLGGLLPQCIIGLKTSDINLNTIIKVQHPRATIILHAACMVIFPLIALLFSSSLLANFQMFLTLVGIAVASWAAVYITDFALRLSADGFAPRPEFAVSYPAVISWVIATVLGLLFTNNPLLDGPFAQGIFRDSSLGMLISFAAAAVLFCLLRKFAPSKAS